MKRLLAVARVSACASMICAAVVVAAGTAVVVEPQAGATGTPHTVKIFSTYFGVWTNTPPTCHTGGTCTTNPGTYTKPIASASDESEPGFAAGTIFYYPGDEKYFKVSGGCTECTTTYNATKFARMDLWLGGDTTHHDEGTAFSLIDCEDALTYTFTGVPEQKTWIATPTPNLPVDPLPLYTGTTGRCHTGAVSPPTFDRYINATTHTCLTNPTYSATAGTSATLAPCTATNKGQDIEFAGAWLYNHGLCLTTALKWAKCTESATKELWEQTSRQTIQWIEEVHCLGESSGALHVTTSKSCVPTATGTKKAYRWTKVAEPAIGLAQAPGKPTVTPGNKSAVVSWTPPATTGAFTIQRYTATSSTGTKFCTTSWNASSAKPPTPGFISGPYSCTVGTLTNGATYTFTVTPWSIGGTGVKSAASTPVTLAELPPTAPAKPTVAAGNESALVSWSAPTPNGTPISSYTVTSSPTAKTCTWTSGPLTCTVKTLTNGIPYTFTITATNGKGTSVASPSSTPVTPGTPRAPARPSAVRGNRIVTISWSAPATNGSPITSYTVTSSPGAKTCSPATLATLSCTVRTLTNGTAYTFTVTATNGVGTSASSAASSAVTPATVPSAPAKPTVTGGNKKAKVTWTAPTNGGTAITSYTATSSPGTKSCTEPSGTLTCTVKTLTNGTPYSFTVTATNGVGTSSKSPTSTPVTPAAAVPSTPTKPTVVAGYQKVTVNWTAPTTNGAPITAYTVTSSGSPAHTCTWSSGPLTCAVTGLTDGTSYTFKVKAHNAVGTSATSSSSSSVKPTKVAPTAPPKPTASPGNASATVSWSAPATNGGTTITKYTVTSSPGTKTCTWSSGLLSCMVTGLTNGTAYTFTVTATNTKGTSSKSPASTPVTPKTAPGAPTHLHATATTGETATLAWTAPATNGGTAITHYTVLETGSPIATPAGTTYRVTGLSRVTTYHFTVTATNGTGTSGASNTLLVTTQETVPGAPTHLHTTATTSSTAALAWTAPATNGGTAITHYTVLETGSPIATPVGTTYPVTGLEPGTTYHFTVTATNGTGTSGASNTLPVTTTTTAPQAPTHLHTTATTSSTTTLAWTAPATNGGTAITHYTVLETGSPIATPVGTSYPVTGLEPGATYHFTVTATNGTGTSGASNTLPVTTEKTVPGAPALSESAKTSTTVTLSWTAPATYGGTAIKHYKVYKTGSLIDTTTGSVTTYKATGLTKGDTYHFAVKAENRVGTSQASNTVAVTITTTAPGSPTHLHMTAKTATTVTLSWTAPTTTGGTAITHYTVLATGSPIATPVGTTYAVTGLEPGTTYHYTVTATNGTGTSLASSTLAVTTSKTAPGAPALSESAKTSTTVTLSWTAPATTGGTAIKHYKVYKTGSLIYTTTSGSVTTYDAIWLTKGDTYHFTVKAQNGAGVSQASDTVTVTTTTTSPGAPTHLHTTVKTATTVTLSWTAPATKGGTAITHYTVLETGSPTATPAGTTYAVTGLVPNTTYHFTVTATNGTGTSLASNTLAVTTQKTVPGAPALRETAKTATTVTLSWTAPATTGGTAIKHYKVYKTGSLIYTTTSGSVTTYKATGLTGGDTYHFTVKAENRVGTSQASNTVAVAITATDRSKLNDHEVRGHLEHGSAHAHLDQGCTRRSSAGPTNGTTSASRCSPGGARFSLDPSLDALIRHE